MMITKKSTITKRVHTMDIPVDPNKYFSWDESEPRTRPLIQNYFPELTEDQREFILNGITPEEWEEFMEQKDSFPNEAE